jgi:transketolase N-terminal domain/subunit
MFKVSTEELKEKAYRIRRDLIELHFKAGSGHLDTSLSLVEIWLALAYSDFFQFNPKDGAWTGTPARSSIW